MAHDETQSSGHGNGLPLTIAAILFLVLRLFAVSGYDWHTAFAVLHTMDVDDSVSIVMGTLMADPLAAAVYLALLTPLAVLWLWLSLREARQLDAGDPAQGRPTRPGPKSGILLLLGALVPLGAYVWSFHAWWLPLTALAVGIVLFAIGRGTKADGRLQQLARWTGRRLGMLILVGWLLAAATVRTPWVPLERIDLRDGAHLRGYVLQAEPGFLKLLTEHRRDFRILTDQEVGSREEIQGKNPHH
uniref:Uncharacterized protein n=1 Tax=Streptomyces nobilis TaxID=66901 RepID=I2CMF0_9ACTN|nr:hypothetical protein [Streptomyces nobilis]